MLVYADITSKIDPSLGLEDKNLVAHHLSFQAFSEIPKECSKNIYVDISVTHSVNSSHLKRIMGF